MKRVRLYKSESWLESWFRRGGSRYYQPAFFCSDRVYANADIPKTARLVWIVFTKLPTEDSFEIGPRGGLADVRESVVDFTTAYLKKQYKAGYRFFHFEYDA